MQEGGQPGPPRPDEDGAIETDELLKLWEVTVGDVDLSELSADASYKPSFTLPETVSSRPAAPDPFVPLDIIARGGIGEIYRARQVGLEREVALKKLRVEKRGSPFARANFVAEAVITGRLEHPNIVPIYALGHAPDGDAYLAMKLVGGQSWKQLLYSEPGRTLHEHLEILLQVGNAVAFAHSRGIVHNDLKPTNVMVGRFGEVLLLDWGLAVDVSPDGPSDELLRAASEIRSPLGTPHYMAPELALGQGERIGPWTDVYLLGGILYEILCRRPPNAGKSLADALNSAIFGGTRSFPEEAPEELRRIAARALAVDPADRHASVAALQEELRGYLNHKESQTIAESARRELERCRSSEGPGLSESDVHRLYEGFAAAVAGFRQARRLWADNPGAARGEREARSAYARAALDQGDLSLAEAQAAQLDDSQPEIRQLLSAIDEERGRRAASEAASRSLKRYLGLTLGLLLLGLSVGLVLLWNVNTQITEQNAEIRSRNEEIASKNHEIAEQNAEIRAQQHFAQRRGEIAEEALDAMMVEVQTQLLVRNDRASRTVARQVLEVAMHGWEQLRDADIAEDRVTRATAIADLRIGGLALDAEADLPTALVAFESAQSRLRQLAAASPENLDAQRDLYVALLHVADVRKRLGETGRALRVLDEALRIARRLVAARQDAASLGDLSFVLEKRGKLAIATGGLGAGTAAFREAVAIDRRLAASPDAGPADSLDLSYALGDLSAALARGNALDSALVAVEEAVALAATVGASERFSVDPLPALAQALAQRGTLRKLRGEGDAARADFTAALGIERTLLARDPDNAELLRNLARALGELGELLLFLDLPAEAVEVLEESLTHSRALADNAPDDTAAATRLCGTLSAVAAAELLVGEIERAEELFEECLGRLRALIALDPQNLEHRQGLSNNLHNYATLLLRQGREEEAVRAIRESLATMRDLRAATPRDGTLRSDLALGLTNLGVILDEGGAPEEALVLHREAEGLLREILDPQNLEQRFELGLVLGNVAAALSGMGQWAEAAPLFRESLGHLRAVAEADSAHLRARDRLADTCLEQGDRAADADSTALAIRSYREAVEHYRRLPDAAPDVCLAQLRLAELLAWTGERPEATAVLRRSLVDSDGIESLPERLDHRTDAWEALAWLHAEAGRGPSAESAWVAALDGARQGAAEGEDPDVRQYFRTRVVQLCSNFCTFLAARGEGERVQVLLLEALDVQRRDLAAGVDSVTMFCQLAGELAYIVSARLEQEGLEQRDLALALLDEARERLAVYVTAPPPEAQTRQEVVRAHNALALGYFLQDAFLRCLEQWEAMARALDAVDRADVHTVQVLEMASGLLSDFHAGFLEEGETALAERCARLLERFRAAQEAGP